MARIIEKADTKTVDTYCEHMGGSAILPIDGIQARLSQAALRALGKLYEYCPICGQKLHKEEQETYEVCSDCGKPALKIGDIPPLYCAFCGEKFEKKIETAYMKQPPTGSGLV